MSTPLAPEANRTRTVNRVLTGMLLLLALAACWHWASNTVQTWYWDRNWSHGFLILPLAGYLIWIRRDQLERSRRLPSWFGVFLTILCIASYLLYYHCQGGSNRGRWSAWLLVFALPLAIAGTDLVRSIWPGLLYTILAVPLSSSFDMQIATPLRKLSTAMAGFLLSLVPSMGLEVQGVTLRLRAGNTSANLEVADACSGFTYLMAVLALGMFMAFMSKRALWQQILITASALPIALLTNAARIVLMGLACLLVGPGAIGPAYHEWWGLAILPLALGLLVLECGILERYFGTAGSPQRSQSTPRNVGVGGEEERREEGETRRRDETADSASSRHPLPASSGNPPLRVSASPRLLTSPIYWTTAIILLLGAGGDYYFRAQRSAAEAALCLVPARTVPLRRPLAQLENAHLSPFRVVMAEPLPDGTVRRMGSTDTVQLTIVDEQSLAPLTVNLIYYTSVGYIKSHRPESCLPAVGFRTDGSGENLILTSNAQGTNSSGLPARLAIFANDELHADQRAYTLMVNRQNGWFVADQEEANTRLLKDGYLSDYLQIVIYSPGPDGQREAFLRSAQRLLRVLLPLLEKEYLPEGTQER